jgi:hypothetical protein
MPIENDSVYLKCIHCGHDKFEEYNSLRRIEKTPNALFGHICTKCGKITYVKKNNHFGHCIELSKDEIVLTKEEADGL